MPNIGQVLKEEIARISRRAVRAQTESTKKASTRHQREIAELKRQLKQLQRQVSVLGRQLGTARKDDTPQDEGQRVRFSAKGMRSHRERIDLSAADYAKLVGVSTQTIYNWERGRTTPSSEQKAKLAELRRIGKRVARARMEASAQA